MDDPNDKLIYEEPEHILLNQMPYYNHKKNKIYGIIHTNYPLIQYTIMAHKYNKIIGLLFYYAIILYANFQIYFLNICHRGIAISPSLNYYLNTSVELVHGIDEKSLQYTTDEDAEGFYFIGQIIALFKNLYLLVEVANKYNIPIDVYGNGPDKQLLEEKDSKKVFAFAELFRILFENNDLCF